MPSVKGTAGAVAENCEVHGWFFMVDEVYKVDEG